jgi:TPR repeat protein
MQYYRLLARKGHTAAMNNLAMIFQNILREYGRAERYYRMAVARDNTTAMINLAWLYFIQKKNKQEAFELLERAFKKDKKVENAYVCSMVLLWNNKIDEAIIRAREFMEDEDMVASFGVGIQPYLMLLIAKKQYNYVYEIFSQNHFSIRDRFKPIYYALMSQIRGQYPDEFRRMGEELKLTVEEILQQINQLARDYA